MRAILRAVFILGASSAVSVLAGIITLKIVAVDLGPSGVGLLALLQSLLGISVIIAGLGVSTAFIRNGAEAIAVEDHESVGRLWTASWIFFWLFSTPVSIGLFLFRTPIARLFLSDPSESGAVGWVSAAVLLTLAGVLNSAFINANHRVSVLARLGVYVATSQAVVVVILILSFGRSGVPFVVVSGAAISWGVSRLLLVRTFPDRFGSSVAEGWPMMRTLVSFGGPFALSTVVGAGVLLLLPVMVVSLFDESAVGYVRAATAISVTYVGFLLASLGKDYFPRLSAISDDSERVNEMANQQLHVIFLVATPFVFAAMALAPIAVPLLYSQAFERSVDILEWQLVGDVFKFTSWALAFTILARGRTWAYFGAEATAGFLLITTTWVGLTVIGLEGFGVAYLMSYVGYCGVVYWIARRATGFRFSTENVVRFGFLGGGALAVRILIASTDNLWVFLVPAVLALVTGTRSLRDGQQLWRVEGSV